MSHEPPPPTAAHESVNEAARPVPANHTPTGAGSEAAEGIHGTGIRFMGERSGLDSRDTGRSSRAGTDRSGSEPLVDRDWVHESGYGGKGGAPRTSSEQRETAERTTGAASADASEAIDERSPSPIGNTAANVGQVRTSHRREQAIREAARSDTGAPDPKANTSK
ncbi:MAG: hypothetical protein M3Z05_22765 [Gemmatimonadota bacterium]|nr:hypothetical protein [Gemmatimonadota bacterium]